MKKVIKILTIITSLICNLCANDFCYFKETDVINLIGEAHYNEECQKFKNFLKKEARNENLILILEGNEFVESENLIFGLEEYVITNLTEAWLFYQHFALYKILQDIVCCGKEQFTPQIKDIIHDFELDINGKIFYDNESVWMLMLRILSYPKLFDIISSNNHEIIKVLKNKILDASDRELLKETANKKHIFLHLHDDVSKWITLWKDIFEFYLQENFEKEQISLDLQKQGLQCMAQFQKYIEMEPDALRNEVLNIRKDYSKCINEFAFNLILNLRNRIFFKNIVSIFENNKWRKKPFYVIVGSAHTPFLYEELRQQGYNIKLNARAQEAVDKVSANASDLVNRTIENLNLEEPGVQD